MNNLPPNEPRFKYITRKNRHLVLDTNYKVVGRFKRIKDARIVTYVLNGTEQFDDAFLDAVIANGHGVSGRLSSGHDDSVTLFSEPRPTVSRQPYPPTVETKPGKRGSKFKKLSFLQYALKRGVSYPSTLAMKVLTARTVRARARIITLQSLVSFHVDYRRKMVKL